MIISLPVLTELIKNSADQREKLLQIFKTIPSTQCRRRTRCCSLLPEMTLIEALAAINRLAQMTPSTRADLNKKIALYFFLNPVEITRCPFLEGQDCLIYQDRFFGCRAYGLWSREYYEKLASSSRHVKEYIRKQWENLGVFLPKDVIEFLVPYCSHVTKDSHISIDDKILLSAADKIETLSKHFSRWHQSFRQEYFSDLSFLLTSLVFGVHEAVRIKFAIVSEIVKKGERERLERIIEELPDLFEWLT